MAMTCVNGNEECDACMDCSNGITDYKVCPNCKQMMEAEDVKEFYCSECWEQWTADNAIEEVINKYISQNEENFYLEWYFTGLLKEEKLEVIKEHFKKVSGTDGYYMNMKKDFCLDDSSHFCDFLEKVEKAGGKYE